jgi:CubicO group peptidase (beta-lactamase class C family)
MFQFKDTLKNLNPTILKIQEISKAERSAIVVGFEKELLYATYGTSTTGEAEHIATDNDEHVFAVASLFKIFIAAGAFLMMDKLSTSSDPTNPYRNLRRAWDKPFTTLFNEYSKDFQLQPLPGNPTLLQLLVHFKGICNINHLLLSPDGTPLQSKEDFFKSIPQYAQDTCGQDNVDEGWFEYSNANYILIALFIEAVSKMPLCDFLKIHIFEPLEMRHTYLSVEDLSSVPAERQARPHVVSSNGYRRVIVFDKIPGLADTVELAALGPYMSAADLGLWFGALNLALEGTPTAFVDKGFVHSLFRGKSGIGGEKYEYRPGGLYTTLDTRYSGSHSLNRLISPDSDSSMHTMGRTSDGKEVAVYYLAGSSTGWGCTAYFVPDKRVFVIVLTNTSGPLDASDIISRLCLQEIFDLRPSKEGLWNFATHLEGRHKMKHSERYRVHYAELASRMFEENASIMKELEDKDIAEDTLAAECEDICGKYVNKSSGQSLIITECEGMLRIRLCGESKSSRLMRFVRKGDVFRICSLVQGFSPGLAIDCFGAWRKLEFKAEQVNKVVKSLSREGLNLVDHFVREDF